MYTLKDKEGASTLLNKLGKNISYIENLGEQGENSTTYNFFSKI